MSKSYVSVSGDTFISISRKSYGDEQYSANIRSANPGVVEPIPTGTELFIPDAPGVVTDKIPDGLNSAENEAAILINGKRFRFWSSFRLTRSIDAMDTLEFTAPFDPDDSNFRDTFKPFTYQSLAVSVGGSPLFTGTLIGVDPSLGPRDQTINVSGYSVPGVLNDCTSPASDFPLEFDDMDLAAIAESLCKPFGIAVSFPDGAGAAFETVESNSVQTVLAFLTGLAKQRGLVISSTPLGVLVFQKSTDAGKPRAILTQGEGPMVSVAPSFSPQQYFSHITGLESVLEGTDGSQYTVRNPHLKGALRPVTFKAGDVESGDLKTSVEAKIGRMYANMASYSVVVNTWRDPSGALWEPNTTIRLTAPGAMVYNAYDFIVRSVSLTRDSREEQATLNLVLPGAFSGEQPEFLPWD